MRIYVTREVKQGRLDGMTILSIDKDNSIFPDEAMAKLSNKRRRLKFVFINILYIYTIYMLNNI